MLQKRFSLTRLLNMALADDRCVRGRYKIHMASEFSKSKHAFQHAQSAHLGTCIPLCFTQSSGQPNLKLYYIPQLLICASFSDNFHPPVKQFEVLLSWRTKPNRLGTFITVHTREMNPHVRTEHKNSRIRGPSARWPWGQATAQSLVSA